MMLPLKLKIRYRIICSYLTFNILYYYAGGRDAKGNAYIYTILDWSNPGTAAGYAFLNLFSIFVMHAIAFALYRYFDKSLQVIFMQAR